MSASRLLNIFVINEITTIEHIQGLGSIDILVIETPFFDHLNFALPPARMIYVKCALTPEAMAVLPTCESLVLANPFLGYDTIERIPSFITHVSIKEGCNIDALFRLPDTVTHVSCDHQILKKVKSALLSHFATLTPISWPLKRSLPNNDDSMRAKKRLKTEGDGCRGQQLYRLFVISKDEPATELTTSVSEKNEAAEEATLMTSASSTTPDDTAPDDFSYFSPMGFY